MLYCTASPGVHIQVTVTTRNVHSVTRQVYATPFLLKYVWYACTTNKKYKKVSFIHTLFWEDYTLYTRSVRIYNIFCTYDCYVFVGGITRLP